MKVLSMWAPWAFALMYLGKDVENRVIKSPVRGVTGRVWIHASMWPSGGGKVLKPGTASWERFAAEYKRAALTYMNQEDSKCEVLPAEYELEHIERSRGQIIGSIEITHYQGSDDPPDSIWYQKGCRAVMVRDPEPLKIFVPAKGALFFWEPTGDVAAALERVSAIT